jgi:hypothetical protein
MKLNAFAVCFAPLLVAGAFSAHAGPQAPWSALITIRWAMTPL